MPRLATAPQFCACSTLGGLDAAGILLTFPEQSNSWCGSLAFREAGAGCLTGGTHKNVTLVPGHFLLSPDPGGTGKRVIKATQPPDQGSDRSPCGASLVRSGRPGVV